VFGVLIYQFCAAEKWRGRR